MYIHINITKETIIKFIEWNFSMQYLKSLRASSALVI